MKELIGDILTTVRFKSAVYFKHGFCGQWGMDVPKSDYAQFHLVTNGRCTVHTDNNHVPLERGDLVIFPKGKEHQIKNGENAHCKFGPGVVKDIMSGHNPFETDDVSTYLICGHYEMDKELGHPLLDQLPETIIIKSNEYGRFDLINSTIELIIEELSVKRPGHEIITTRFAEVLFISILRHYYLGQSNGITNIFNDGSIYEALDFIHKKIETNLNIDTLSRHTGLSRTLFIQRFKDAVGEPPLKYIKNWRMTKAKSLLRDTNLSLLEITEQVGYSSQTSFNRVFKQTFNITPKKFRLENA